MAPAVDPALHAKGLKTVAKTIIVSGLLIGIGMPALLSNLGITVARMSSGFDAMWFVMQAIMACDFVAAWILWRRATVLDRAAQGLPPRGQ